MRKKLKKLSYAGLALIGVVFALTMIMAFLAVPRDASAAAGMTGLTSLMGLAFFGTASATGYDSSLHLRTVKFTHTASVVADEIIVGNGRPLVSCGVYAANVEGVYIITGKAAFPRAAGLTFEIGDKVYFDPDTLNITQSQGNAILCGYCLEKSALTDTTIVILLWPISTEVTDAAADSKADSASVRASTADSKAVSNSVIESTNLSVGASKAASLAVVDSTNLSTGDSKAASNSDIISTADSKAVSVSVIASSNKSTADSKSASLAVIDSTNLSTGDSKAASNSVLTSTADSKAVSNSVIESTNKSVGDSKSASLAVIDSTNLSTGDSKAASNSILISTADSKAVSNSVVISTLDSKVASYHP